MRARLTEGEDKIKFELSDTSKGIMMDNVKNLNNYFGKETTEETLSLNKNMVGMGLIVSNSLVKLLNND